jgi:molecular chaperone DnaK
MTTDTDRTEPAVGIDLGTTYSVVSHLDETGRPVTIVNGEGDLLTASVVLFDGPDIVVGKEAVKAMGTESQKIADCSKRDVGRRAYRKKIDGHEYPPEVIEACVLKKIKDDCARRIGSFSKCVITVPAFFDEVRRKATQDAGAIAGLDVIDIINEPTAAAVAYGFRHGFLNPAGEAHKPLKVLVYDLGGGTFDVTLMDIQGRDFVAVATDGDVELGGRDWDNRLMDYVAEQFQLQFGGDPRQDPDIGARLWRDCEEAKRTLTARNRATITCDFQGHAARIEITREQFEEMTRDLLDRTEFTVRQLLKNQQLDWGQVDRVLLVGGSSRMPMVRNMLHKLSGKPADDSVSADEAVAQGAALHCGLLLAKKSGREPLFKIKNVNSHSLGVIGTSRKTNRKQNVILIPKNTQLPFTAKKTFKTSETNQKSVVVTIVEGESSSPEACTPIGECKIDKLPPNLPALTPVEVFFRYAENGRLGVAVSIPGIDKQVQQEIIREAGLGKEQIDAWHDWLHNDGKK